MTSARVEPPQGQPGRRIFLNGLGAVSPAGWTVKALFEALEENRELGFHELKRPGWKGPLLVRKVPVLSPRPAFMSHPRLRRTSAITHYAISAALEALGEHAELIMKDSRRLGIVFCVMTGCVNYSRRFYEEALHDPATASPLLFPETVFNAPSSHLAALLQTLEMNYTLVGDPGTFLQGLALAADWLVQDQVDDCLVVGAEEVEWMAVDAYRLSAPNILLAEGAGAVYLSAQPGAGGVQLSAITHPQLFFDRASRMSAALKMGTELRDASPADLLCDGRQGISNLDLPEDEAWQNWRARRYSPKKILGEGLMAAAAWQCITAAEALRRGRGVRANISIVGCNQQAIGAQFHHEGSG